MMVAQEGSLIPAGDLNSEVATLFMGIFGSILSVSSVSPDLSTALMLVEVNEARDASDNVCRFVHHNHGSCTETSLCPDQVIKVHEHIVTYTETQRSKSMSIKRAVNET